MKFESNNAPYYAHGQSFSTFHDMMLYAEKYLKQNVTEKSFNEEWLRLGRDIFTNLEIREVKFTNAEIREKFDKMLLEFMKCLKNDN